MTPQALSQCTPVLASQRFYAMADCDLQSADLVLVVQACPDVFDFSLRFEQLVFCILPNSLIIVAVAIELLARRNSTKNCSTHDGRTVGAVNSPLSEAVLQQPNTRRGQLLELASFFTLLALQLTVLIQWATTHHARPATAIPSAVLSLLAISLLACLSYLHHRTTTVPSPLIECSLFFTSLFEAVQVRSYWLRTPDLQGPAIATSISLAVRVFTLFVESQSQKKGIEAPTSFKSSVEPRYGLIGQVSFWWLNPLFLFGWKSTIPLKWLWSVDTALSSEGLANAFANTKSSCERTGLIAKHSLALKCLRLCNPPLRASAVTRLGLLAATYAQPFLTERVVAYLGHGSEPGPDEMHIGRGLIGATAVIYLSIAVTTAHYKHQVYRAITMTRGVLVLAIYRKILVLGEASEELLGAMTLMSTDVERIAAGLQEVHDIWASLLGTVVGCTILGVLVRVGVVIPVFLVLVSFTGTLFLVAPNGRAQLVWNQAIQERVNVIASTLGAIKFIKMCGLSPVLESVIQAYRVRELEKSKKLRRFTAIINISTNIPEFLAPVLVLTMLWATRPQDFTVSNALATLSVIVLLTENLNKFLNAITLLKVSFSCFGRIQRFLDLPEAYASHSDASNRVTPDEKDSFGLTPSNARAARNSIELQDVQERVRPQVTLCSIKDGIISPKSSGFELRDINVHIPLKSVTMLVGPVASGKSLLLKSIVGEVSLISGSLTRPAGGIAYCAQTPFIWKSSLRANILGESLCDPQWYKTVLEACALQEVISRLPLGDATNVGNHGSMLSGGQQQRVSLARAVYSHQPLLVLDDALSGLDRSTQAFVLERLLGTNGLCRKLGLTVVMATSSTSQVAFADQVIVVGHAGASIRTARPDKIIDVVQSPLASEEDAANGSPPAAEEMPQIAPAEEDEEDMKSNRGSGDIQLYVQYVRSMGYLCSATFLFLAVMFVFFLVFPQKWLQLWAQSYQHDPATNNNALYIGIYAMAAILGLLTVGATIGYWFIYAVPRSATSLHLTLLQTVMRAPYSWLLNTNTGKTLNRFSQDMSLVDLTLPSATLLAVISALNCIGSLIFVVLSSVWLAIAIPAILGVLYVVQSVYLRTSRQLRLLDLEAKSPLYTHYGETIDGLATIRAYRWQAQYVKRGMELLDRSQSPFYLLYCAQRWLNFVLDMMVAGIATLLVGVGIALKGTSSSDGGSIGVALVNIITFSQNLTLLVQFWTTMETSLGAIARVAEMVSDTPVEAQDGEDQDLPPGLLEHAPSIHFRDVSAKAMPGSTDLILKNVSLSIPARGKTAIVGPSGSGKSSLLLALARLLHLHSGQILLDGRDIACLKRDALRQQIAIMSQAAPVLSGTARFNLDPFGLVNDPSTIMAALAKVGLDSKLEAQGGLGAFFADLNLSAGEKQLFRFAAVLLSGAKLVLLDEVTSNLDTETERKIMRMIEEELGNRTIVTVAHHLDTILDYNQVVVMESGAIAETGRPKELLELPTHLNHTQT